MRPISEIPLVAIIDASIATRRERMIVEETNRQLRQIRAQETHVVVLRLPFVSFEIFATMRLLEDTL